MDALISVVILGIIEGVTEFLPISSTGHLIVAGHIFKLSTSSSNLFEIFIQVGAVVAVIAYYWSDIWIQIKTVRSSKPVRRLWLAIIIAFIPAAVIGVLFNDVIDAVLFSPVVVAISLIVGGVMFLLVEYSRMQQSPANSPHAESSPTSIADLQSITYKQAFMVGIWQVLSLVPGMSRSGMSIIGGMISGLDRTIATQFSFYLAIPTLGGATVYTLIRNLDHITSDDMVSLAIGTVVSAIVSWIAIRWLLKYISSHSFISFGYYRIIIGAVILLLIAQNIL